MLAVLRTLHECHEFESYDLLDGEVLTGPWEVLVVLKGCGGVDDGSTAKAA